MGEEDSPGRGHRIWVTVEYGMAYSRAHTWCIHTTWEEETIGVDTVEEGGNALGHTPDELGVVAVKDLADPNPFQADGEMEAGRGKGQEGVVFEVGSEGKYSVDGGIDDATELGGMDRREVATNVIPEVLEAPKGQLTYALTPRYLQGNYLAGVHNGARGGDVGRDMGGLILECEGNRGVGSY